MNLNPFGPVTRAAVMVNGHVLPNKHALVNEAGHPMSIVSKNYKVVPNQTVVDLFGNAFNDLEIEKSTDHLDVDASRWRRRIVLKKNAFNFEIVPGDCVGVMLELFNSYTGKSSWGFRLMGYRWACTNGLIVGKRELFSATFSHMTNIIDKMRNAFSNQLANVNSLVETWKEWQGIEFTPKHMSDFLEHEEVKEKAAETIMYAFHQRTAIERLPWNKWAAYNALTYLGTHELKTRKRGADPIFSASAKRYNRLAEALYNYTPVARLEA